jgi:hypothetical protein
MPTRKTVEDHEVSTLPHESEPIEGQRARYREALRETFDVESMRLGNVLAPELIRRHVFDSPDGLRLVVRIEAKSGWGKYLHVSASFDSDSELFEANPSRLVAAEPVVELILDRYHAISGDSQPLNFMGLSPTGVPHWFRTWRKED